MRSPPGRAFLLPAVLSLIVALIVAVAALHHYEVLGSRAVSRVEADLNFLVSRRWQLYKEATHGQAEIPSGLPVSVETTATAGVSIDDDLAAGPKLFQHELSYRWTGLPNLLVKRNDSLHNAPAPLTTDSLRVPKRAGSVFHGQQYREVTTAVPELCAYAPHGGVYLDKVVDWSNPEMELPAGQDALQSYTGAPVAVAGNQVEIGEMPYGFVYASEKNPDAPKAVQVGRGLAIARTGPFPFPHFEEELVDAIATGTGGNSAFSRFQDCARYLDDKTQVFSGEPHSISDLLTGKANLNEWATSVFSLNGAFNAKCMTLFWPQELSTTGRFHAVIRVHPPHPSELAYGKDKFIQEKIRAFQVLCEAKGKAVKIAQEQRMAIAARQGIFEGYEATQEVFLVSYASQGNTGLLKTYRNVLVPKLKRDLELVKSAVASGRTDAVTDLECTNDLILWLAKYSAFAFPDHPEPKLPDDFRPQVVPKPDWNQLRQQELTPALAGQALAFLPFQRTRFDYETGKTSVAMGTGDVTDPAEEVKESDARQAHSRLWLDVTKQAQGLKVTAPAGQAVTAPYLQKLLLEYLLDTDNPQNFLRLADIQTGMLKAEADKLDTLILALNGQIADLAKEIVGLFMKTIVPHSRDDEKELAEEVNPAINPSFDKNKGIPGTNRIPYGFNIFFFINLIRGAVSPDTMKEMWEPVHPMVYFGYPKNSTPGTLDVSSDGIELEGVLTVPSGRTLFYEHDVKVKGDVWLQRGSTLVCKNLQLENGEGLDHGWDFTMMKPCGRVLMEEGSTLICQGNLEAAGGPYRGSIVQLSAKDTIHPITCAVICKGEVKLPYGIWNAQKFGDAVTGDFKGDAANWLMNVYTAHICAIFSKAPVLGAFHWRRPYFASNAADFELNVSIIWVGFFPLPIILLDDREAPAPNLWVPIYQWMSVFQAVYCNLAAGENFMVSSTIYPHQGTYPLLFLLHKISLKSIFQADRDLPEIPPELRQFDYKKYVQGKMEQIQQHLQLAQQSPLQPAKLQGSQASLSANAQMLESRLLAEENDDPVIEAFKVVLKALLLKLINLTGLVDAIWKATGAESDAMRQKLCREQQGVLVYGESIDIGMGKTGVDRPKFATGLFVAERNININAIYTIGAIVSNGGSINQAGGVHTTLLAYPAFTTASLHLPKYDPAAAADGEKIHWLERQKDLLWYGENLPKGENVEISLPRSLRVTAQGWDR